MLNLYNENLAKATTRYREDNLETVKTCIFCGIDRSTETYFETPNFLIAANPFYIVPGHLMIISKSHYGCVGELPSELFEEFIACKTFAQNVIKTQLNIDPIFYEHGRAGSCISASEDDAKCEHMHFHILPTDINISDKILNNLKTIQITTSSIRDQFEKYGSYLFFENKDGGRFSIVDTPGQDRGPYRYSSSWS